MCGIAGILRVHPPGAPPPPPEVAIPEAWLDILDESIKHRGPDGQGRFRDRAVRPDGTVVDVALVHRRLAIIDLAGGGQPMGSLRAPPGGVGESPGAGEAGLALLFHGAPNDPVRYRPLGAPTLARGARQGDADLVAVVFNGCIYNHRELRRELQAAGHEFETDHSDTEVLVHGWREWGAELVGRLDGMYAAAIWDRHAGTLALARDPAGEKPLHLGGRTMDGAPVVFASSDAALLRVETRANGAPIRDNQLWRGFTKDWLSMGWDRVSPLGTDSQVRPGTIEVAPNRRRDRPMRILDVACVRRPGRRGTTSRLDADSVERLIEHAVPARLEARGPGACV